MDTYPHRDLGDLRFPGRKNLSADTAGKKITPKGRRRSFRGWLCRGLSTVSKETHRKPAPQRALDRERLFGLERNGLSFSMEAFFFVELNRDAPKKNPAVSAVVPDAFFSTFNDAVIAPIGRRVAQSSLLPRWSVLRP